MLNQHGFIVCAKERSEMQLMPLAVIFHSRLGIGAA
jgi:hypothetical protein